MYGLNNFDTTDGEYPVLMTKLDYGGQRSRVKVTAGPSMWWRSHPGAGRRSPISSSEAVSGCDRNPRKEPSGADFTGQSTNADRTLEHCEIGIGICCGWAN